MTDAAAGKETPRKAVARKAAPRKAPAKKAPRPPVAAKKIAAALKASAERSERRKASPFRSAMSMLSFYLNRAGPTVSAAQRRRLEAAKDELRRLFDRPPQRRAAAPKAR